jgi:hypothetical protein
VKSYPKPQRIKSESYRRYVASFPCFACGVEGFSQAAHPNGAGGATKASDLEVFPLCCTRPGVVGCHAEFDQCIGMTWEDRDTLTTQYVRRMQDIARAAGRWEFA